MSDKPVTVGRVEFGPLPSREFHSKSEARRIGGMVGVEPEVSYVFRLIGAAVTLFLTGCVGLRLVRKEGQG